MTDVEKIREELKKMGDPYADEYSKSELRVHKAYGDLVLTLEDIIRDLEEKVSELNEQANEFEAAKRRRCEKG